MFITKRLNLTQCFAAGLLGMIPLYLPGQTAPGLSSSLPTLDQVMDQHLKAIGGRTALTDIGPLVLKGNCNSSHESESGPVEIVVKSPKVAYDLDSGNLRIGYDGNSVWRKTFSEPLQQRRGRQFAELATVFDPSRALWWKEWYPQIAVTGVRDIDGRHTLVLETVPGSPSTERLFIDRQSGLLIRDEVTSQFIFTLSDYRPVKGVMIAYTIEEKTPDGATYTYRFEDIKPAGAIDDSRFRPR